uniref:L1 transposable element RRM domain-containing protein n=1 Tax=Erpetoichthys calabaricus TaxID=27687 RepID=A0A8C4RF67_ERPCA
TAKGKNSLKLKMALPSTLSSTPREPGTSTLTGLKDIKKQINDIRKEINDIRKSDINYIRKEIKDIHKTNKKLLQDIKDQEKHVNNHFEAAFKGMLEKSEEQIQENASKFENKLRALGTQLEDVKQTFTTQIEIAKQLESTTDGKATAANSECKILGDRLPALEDECRRNNINIEGLPENRESQNPVKFIPELFSKIIGEDFKSDTEVAATYCIRGSNTSKPRTLIIIFENNHIRIFPDFSPSTAAKRATFNNIKKCLWKAMTRYSLLYPVKLKVDIQGKLYIFIPMKEAEKELRKLIPTLF